MSSMTDEQTYNGWKNYPTWCINLWLENDEGIYRETLRRLDGSPDRVTAADTLKDFVVGDLAPDLGASFAADLLGYALDQVDWFEIADVWLEQVNED